MMSIHCSKCMDKKDTKEIEPLGHSYTEFVKTKEPTSIYVLPGLTQSATDSTISGPHI